MKIALVSPYDYPYPGGVTSHIRQFARHARRAGHVVKILAPSSADAETLRRESVIPFGRPIAVPASGSVARISLSLRLAGPVQAVLQAEQFDVVHLHEPLAPSLPITVLRCSRAANVGTFHAVAAPFSGTNMAYLYGRPILRRWFRRLDGKIAVSPAARAYVNRYFPDSYQVIPNGIDFAHFSADAPPMPELRDDRLNVLFVGRLEKRKGLRYLLGALAQVQRERPMRLVVVGPDDGRGDEYRRLAAERGLGEAIFTGYVPYGDLPRYYQSADIFCAPSVGHESFGIVLLEAMAAGRPVVASNIGGYASVLQHEVEGLLVPPRDEEALAAALLRLASEPALRRALGARGRDTAAAYDWELIAERILAYYRRLLGQTCPASIDDTWVSHATVG